MVLGLCLATCLAPGFATNSDMMAQDLQTLQTSAAPLQAGQSTLQREGPGLDAGFNKPPLQGRFRHAIKLKGLIVAEGQAIALVEIRNVRLLLPLGKPVTLGSGLTGDVVFAEIDALEQLHLQFRGEATTAIFRDEYNPLVEEGE